MSTRTLQQLGNTEIITQTGIVIASTFDHISPDRIALMLFRGATGATYGKTVDETPVIARDLKDLIVEPFSEFP